MGSRLAVTLCALMVATAFSQPARATEPPAAEKETARALMDEGHSRADGGDHKGALVSFSAADAIMHVPTTGLEVARQQVALGMLVEARDTILRVHRLPIDPHEPAVFASAREAALVLDDDLASRIPVLRVSVKGVSSLTTSEITLDGVSVPPLALDALRVNPGHHLVEVKLDGGRGHAAGETDVAEGSTTTLELKVDPGQIHRTDPSWIEPDESSPPAPASKEGATARDLLRWGGAGLGGVGVVVGAATGIVSLSVGHSAKSMCSGNQCPPSSWSDLHTARTTATVSDAAFVAAGVGVAAFVTSFLLPSRTGGVPSSARITPWMSPTSAGLFGRF